MRARILPLALVAAFGCEDVQRRPSPYQSQFETADILDAQRAEGAFDEYAEYPRDQYPEGPYGVEIESLIANYSFESVDGVITIDSIRRDPSRSVLWILHAAPWCPACQLEIPTLPALHGERWDEGLQILGVVSSDLAGNVPTADDAASTFGDVQFPAGADTREVPSLVEDQFSAGMILIPENTLVDLDTMRIRAHMTGWSESEMSDLLDYVLAP